MLNENSTQFKAEGEPAFAAADTETENSAAPSAGEQTNADQTGSSDQDKDQTQNKNGGKETDGEKGKGFADDPRWIERESDWKNRFNDQETRHVSEIAKLREDIDKRFPLAEEKKPMQTGDTPGKIPEWFGGDDEQWAQFQEWNKGLLTQAEENAYKRLTDAQGKEKKQIDEATTYLNDEVSALEADKVVNPEGQKIDRNKLLKTALDNDLVDSKGRWNYKAAFKMMKPADVFKAKDAMKERKQIADATTSDNRAEQKQNPYATSTDFSKPGARPW
jgi:hypothetical protein